MVPRWLVELVTVLLTAAGAVVGLLALAFLPFGVLALLGTVSVALGFALASWAYGRGYLSLPDEW